MKEIDRKYIVAEVLLGIRSIHQRFICHRDMKPENVLLNETNRVKICDFGEAKKFDQAALVELGAYYLTQDQLMVANPNKLKASVLQNNIEIDEFSNNQSEASFFSQMFSKSEKISTNEK